MTEFDKRADKDKGIAITDFEETFAGGANIRRKGTALVIIDTLPR